MTLISLYPSQLVGLFVVLQLLSL